MIIVRSDSLILTENLVGAFLYLFGTLGSYYRFERLERKGRLDAVFLMCMTWGFCSLMISTLNILKYSFIPSLHLEVIRAIYYLGAGVTSWVFFAMSFEKASFRNLLAMMILVGGVAFAFAEGLVFYFGFSYPAALFSCSGLLLLFFSSMSGRLSLGYALGGVAIFLLPLLPIVLEQGIDVDELKKKREVAMREIKEQILGAHQA